MNTIDYSMQDCLDMVETLAKIINESGFKPDIIVGITQGGLFPAIFLSQHLNIPMYTLDVRLHSLFDVASESNCWLSEWAFGYDEKLHNILVVDDIVNTGETINWVINDWESTCLPDSDKWKSIWHNSTRFASLIYNTNADFNIDFCVNSITNDTADPIEINFPWRKKTNE